MTLKIIGAGFGRTGTLSLKFALEQLGFAPCYHMMEVWRGSGDSDKWEAIANGATPDWNDVFAGYPATVDWPSCHYWRDLAKAYPDAKILLTERDPEAWYKSIASTIFPQLDTEPYADPRREAQRRMAHLIVIEQTFGGRLDRDHVIDVYLRHNEAVKREVPAGRLLVYDTPQGWGPLCAFLGVPMPDAPFPRTNSTEEFRNRQAARAGSR
jgi:hypothetical protein